MLSNKKKLWLGYSSSRGGYSNNYSGVFNGTDAYLSLPDDEALSFGDGAGNDSAFTICAWVRPSDAANFRVIGRGSGLGGNVLTIGTPADGLFQVVLYSGVTTTNINAKGSAATEDEWQQLIVTYDATKANTGFEMYVNAVKQTLTRGNGSGTYVGMSDLSNLNIGRFNNNGTIQYASGHIDEVAVFKGVVFNQSEVNAAYGGGAVVNLLNHSQAANLSAYYRMENDATDSSGNGLNSTNHNVTFSDSELP